LIPDIDRPGCPAIVLASFIQRGKKDLSLSRMGRPWPKSAWRPWRVCVIGPSLAEKMDHVLSFLEQAMSDASMAISKADIVATLPEVVQEFRHVETGAS
jgi:hypothetical protein